MEYRFLTLDTFSMDPRYLDEPGVALGDGIDLCNPSRTLVAPCRAFVAAEKGEPEPTTGGTEAEWSGLLTSKSSVTENARFLERVTEKEEALVLSAHFKATYMLSSLDAAVTCASNTSSSFHTIYLLIEHSGEARRLPASGRIWTPDVIPVSESIADDDDALRQFVSRYGTHYVSTIRYGLRIGVQGKQEETNTEKKLQFSASFKAAFGSFSAEGKVEGEHKTALKDKNVDLVLEATSGGREDGGLLVAQGFEDIHQLLSDASMGKIKFHVAPIEVTMKPYWPTLDPKWERTRALLDPATALRQNPGAPYGVPAGTIVAWHPTPNYVMLFRALGCESPETQSIEPPPGWAFCDGKNGTPDLKGQFIRGIDSLSDFLLDPCAQHGHAEHDHGTHHHTTEKTNQHFKSPGGGAAHDSAEAGHSHKVKEASSEKTPHLPPYVKVVYIMKLHEAL